MEVINIINLTKRYRDLVVIDNLNLKIKEKELFSLLGVNGAGKTTLIKILSCLVKPNEGEIFIYGNNLAIDEMKVKNIIGVSPQENAVAYNLTVKENLEFICGVYGFSKEKTKMKIDELTNQFGLVDIIDKKTNKLSGGQKRKVSIALALISEPKILFLDEPTLGLDVLARADLWEIINCLKKKITIILTTHYMEEAEVLSDRIGIMDKGKLLIVDSVDNIKKITGTNRIEDAFIDIVRRNGK